MSGGARARGGSIHLSDGVVCDEVNSDPLSLIRANVAVDSAAILRHLSGKRPDRCDTSRSTCRARAREPSEGSDEKSTNHTNIKIKSRQKGGTQGIKRKQILAL
eukprot:768716-Hanusia_phi.AAC.8